MDGVAEETAAPFLSQVTELPQAWVLRERLAQGVCPSPGGRASCSLPAHSLPNCSPSPKLPAACAQRTHRKRTQYSPTPTLPSLHSLKLLNHRMSLLRPCLLSQLAPPEPPRPGPAPPLSRTHGVYPLIPALLGPAKPLGAQRVQEAGTVAACLCFRCLRGCLCVLEISHRLAHRSQGIPKPPAAPAPQPPQRHTLAADAGRPPRLQTVLCQDGTKQSRVSSCRKRAVWFTVSIDFSASPQAYRLFSIGHSPSLNSIDKDVSCVLQNWICSGESAGSPTPNPSPAGFHSAWKHAASSDCEKIPLLFYF